MKPNYSGNKKRREEAKKKKKEAKLKKRQADKASNDSLNPAPENPIGESGSPN